jgi:hypothetical protein
LEDTVHSVEVTADSLYEAVARGMKALQSNDWSGPGACEVRYVDVTVKEPEVTHRVNLTSSTNRLIESAVLRGIRMSGDE